MIDKVLTRLRQKLFKKRKTNHGIILTQQLTLEIHMVIKKLKCKWTDTNVLYLYNKTVEIWLFRNTGSNHYPLPMFISLGCTSGNKPGLGVMETAYIPHNYALSVY